jgi:branched-chain amino acid transport system substrate-binding protein
MFQVLLKIAIVAFIFQPAARAEVGVSDSEISVGTVNVQSGPAANLGLDLNAGAKAYIDKVNASGGVNGRKLKWVMEDDGYEPSRTIEKAKKLIDQDKVFCLFNSVGTPTSQAILPLLAANDVPLVGAFTGAEVLRNPIVKNVFNIRGSYWDEAELMVANAVDKKGFKKIAIFMQDDAFGTAVQGGVVKALAKRGLKPVALGKFRRNTEEINEGMTEVSKASPDVIIMVGTYKPLALFVKSAKTRNLKAILFTVSFVGTESFVKEVGDADADVYVTQVVPSPVSSTSPIVAQYQEAMKVSGGKLSYGSLEGYLNAVTLVEGLKAAGKRVTRDGFRNAMETMDKSLGGIKVQYTKGNHQGSSAIFLTKVGAGKATEVLKVE